MADLPSDFWSGWIVVLTVGSLAAMSYLIWSAYFSSSPHDDEPSPVWDENLTEGSHPAPMWWFWLILASLVLSVIYLMLYPGLGSFRGALEWSQGGELARRTEAFEDTFGPRRKAVLDTPVDQLGDDALVMASARRVFSEHCEACHGSDAGGQAGAFPDLRDEDWQWGGDAAQIEQTIRHGRQGVMIGWQAVLGDEGVGQVVQHVRSLSGAAEPSAEGAARFGQFCAACHGPGGEGMAAVGGPNLTDEIWLYGGSPEAVRQTVIQGRHGIMPAFDERLDDVQVHMLVAWLRRGGS